ncbi:MAG: class IV adenylate cyclase [Phycisphaerales bacterium]|nr:class IV adenylate cyclase [Phycisphaerales bacterium]
MQNIELKAEIRDLDIARAQCRRLGAKRIRLLRQRDTYFRLTSGRLKRRETEGEPTEWIFYHRPDRAEPRMSHFKIYDEQQALTRFGTQPLPTYVVVEKNRELWMLDNVRIHLDEVDRLGRFIEFEALVDDDNDVQTCHRRIADLRDAFGPIMGELISCSYADLVAAEAADQGGASE